MNKMVHGHTFRDDILTEGGYVLDLGCNDFKFSNHMINRGMKVIGLDPIRNIIIPTNLKENQNFTYLQRACVGVKESETGTYYEYQHWGANSVVNTPELLHRERNGGHGRNPSKDSYQVPFTTIKELMVEFNIDRFECIKMDIEGAEYNIVENLPKSCTKQLTVEYHDFLDLNPSSDIEAYHENLVSNILTEFYVGYEDKTPFKYNINVFQRNDILYLLKND